MALHLLLAFCVVQTYDFAVTTKLTDGSTQNAHGLRAPTHTY